MSLAAVIVNPSLMIRDYKTEYIVYFLPVLQQELIRIICFKNFETYILSCQFRNIYLLKKVKIFRREYVPPTLRVRTNSPKVDSRPRRNREDGDRGRHRTREKGKDRRGLGVGHKHRVMAAMGRKRSRLLQFLSFFLFLISTVLYSPPRR